MKNYISLVILSTFCLFTHIYSVIEVIPNNNPEQFEQLLHNRKITLGNPTGNVAYKKIVVDLVTHDRFNPNITKAEINPLAVALANQDFEFVKWLILHGADPLLKVSKGSLGQLLQEIINYLNFQSDNNRHSPRAYASFSTQLKQAREMERYFNNYEELLVNSFYKAIENEDVSVIKALIMTHPSLLMSSYGHYRPIPFAFSRRQYSMAQLLHSLASRFNVKVDNTMSPLIAAIHNLDLEAVRLLLVAGEDPNQLDQQGLTPWNHAIKVGNDAIVKLLKQYGARPAAESPPAA